MINMAKRRYETVSGCSGEAAFIIAIVIAALEFIADEPRISLTIICAIAISGLILSGISQYLKYLANNKEDYKQQLDREFQIAIRKKEDELNREKKEVEMQIKDMELKEQTVRALLINSQPFKKSATMTADLSSQIFEKEHDRLLYKSHPALKAANAVSELKHLYKSVLQENKEKQYKWEYLISVFPELQKYIDDDAALLSLSNYNSV